MTSGKPRLSTSDKATRPAHAPPPAADASWSQRERRAWLAPPRIKPSEWAPRYFRIRRGNRKGPYRHENAPYLRGLMDIATRPGVVQFNFRKPGQIGGSTLLRVLMAYWAHTDPAPMGLTLPNRDKGRQIAKGDVRPLFRHLPVLRDLVGNPARDLLIESIKLLNGFECDLMWSGSAASTASNPYRRVINDETDKYEPWTGDDADAIAATEGRLTSYEDRRLQANTSTPTTIAGTIHRLYEHSTVRLEYQVPCPHCGVFQPLLWKGVKWLSAQCCQASIAAAEAALADGAHGYCIRWAADEMTWIPCERDEDGASPIELADTAALQEHVAWLSDMQARLELATGRREVGDVLAAHRERAIWYECRDCRGRIHNADKPPMARQGRWRSAAGPVRDADGQPHDNAEDVERWPPETRVGATMTGLSCLWLHWGSLVVQWLGAQDDPRALFFFVTFRLGEPFEFRARRVADSVFSAKCARATLPPEIVPAWAWMLLATIDTQPDHFYVVVRAWGGSMRSQRIWHGKLMGFDELDKLIYAKQWPVAGGQFPAMTIARALIDSGGTMDKVLMVSRTQQVYQWAIPRQPIITAIKGASKPAVGLYWPMKNPMSEGGKADYSSLRAIMVDPHKANDLLSEMIAAGTPGLSAAPPSGTVRPPEQWLLNTRDDGEYNAHMANVQKTVDPRSRAEIWTPKSTAARHDYRDCEVYQMVAAYLANIHLLPDLDEVVDWKRRQAAMAAAAPDGDRREYAERFQRR